MKALKVVLLTIVLGSAVTGYAQPKPSDLMGLGMPPALAGLVGQGGWDQNLVFKDASSALTREIIMGTVDGDDDAILCLSGGGDCNDESRGAWLQLNGNEANGSINLQGGALNVNSSITIQSNHDDANVLIRGGNTPTTIASFDSGNGNVTLSFGDLDIETSGKTLILEDGTAASTCLGNATANGTTAVTVNTTCPQTGDYVFISRSGAPSGTAQCWATNIVSGTSFDLDCSGAETGTFHWWVLKGQ